MYFTDIKKYKEENETQLFAMFLNGKKNMKGTGLGYNFLLILD
jgi:hypothetical protein